MTGVRRGGLIVTWWAFVHSPVILFLPLFLHLLLFMFLPPLFQGNAHIFLGEFERAAEHYKMTLQLAQELGDRAVEAQVRPH